MAAIEMSWPVQLFPRQSSFQLENVSRSGGLSLTGAEQVTVSGAGRWRARLQLPVMRHERVLAYRAMMAQLEGRAGTILVPKWERHGVRDANGRQFDQVEGTGLGDGLLFDLAGLGQSDFIHATLAASAAVRATRISINVTDGEGPRPGQYIGIGKRLYLVSHAWQESEAAVIQVQFSPWLREAADDGTRIILDRPVCLMRLASDLSGELELDMGSWGNASVEFVEAV